MAGGLAPLDRPDGSQQVLRYRGTVAVSGAAAATYPKVPGVTASDSAISGTNFLSYVRLPFFDATTPVTAAQIANLRKRFPELVFDDSQLAASSPHAAVACVASVTPGVNVADLSLNRRAWAQNVDIKVRRVDNGNGFGLADAGVSINSDPINGAQIVLDTLTSGMGLNTGLPVLILQCVTPVNGQGAIQSFFLDVTIEIRHSEIR